MWFLANFSDSKGGTPSDSPLTYHAALCAALESNLTNFTQFEDTLLMERDCSCDSVLTLIYRIDAHDLKTKIFMRKSDEKMPCVWVWIQLFRLEHTLRYIYILAWYINCGDTKLGGRWRQENILGENFLLYPPWHPQCQLTSFEWDEACSICTCSLWKYNNLWPSAIRLASLLDLLYRVQPRVWVFSWHIHGL